MYLHFITLFRSVKYMSALQLILANQPGLLKELDITGKDNNTQMMWTGRLHHNHHDDNCMWCWFIDWVVVLHPTTQNRSFQRRFLKPIFWLSMEKTKPNTTKAHIHQSKENYTHTRLMALFPGLPGWAGTRKVKPIWISLKQETVSGSGISWAICKSAPRSILITTPAPHHSVFLQAGCPSCRPTNSVKANVVPIKTSPFYFMNNSVRIKRYK